MVYMLWVITYYHPAAYNVMIYVVNIAIIWLTHTENNVVLPKSHIIISQ